MIFWTNRAASPRPTAHKSYLSPRGEGNTGRALQPGRAWSRAPFSLSCSFPVPLRKQARIPCSGRLEFPVPRPLQPATVGLQSWQRHDIAGLPGTDADCGAKKFPASREIGSSSADRERDDFGPNRLPEWVAAAVLEGGLSSNKATALGAFTPRSCANSGWIEAKIIPP